MVPKFIKNIFEELQLAATQYCWRTIDFALYLSNNVEIRQNIYLFFYFYWALTSAMIFPLTLMFIGFFLLT